jgi:hypothetical protein
MTAQTIRVAVTETTTYVADVEVTEALLDQAEDYGYERDADGVFSMLHEDSNHDTVIGIVTGTADTVNVETRDTERIHSTKH